MTSIRQNKEIVVGILSSLLFVSGAGFVAWNSSAATSESVSDVSESTRDRKVARNAESKPSWVEVGSLDSYDVIASRNLFRGQGNPTPRVVNERPLPQLPPLAVSSVQFSEVTNQQQAPVHTPQTDKIVVVGAVTMDGKTLAVVEDLSQGETRWVAVGDSAFGYRVASLSQDKATLEREGKTYDVEYGANKPEVRPRQTSSVVMPPNLQNFPMVPNASDPNSPRSWDWRSMTDEQRNAARDYLRGTRRERGGDNNGNGDGNGDRGSRAGRGRDRERSDFSLSIPGASAPGVTVYQSY